MVADEAEIVPHHQDRVEGRDSEFRHVIDRAGHYFLNAPHFADFYSARGSIDRGYLESLLRQMQRVAAGTTSNIQNAAAGVLDRLLLGGRPLPVFGEVLAGVRTEGNEIVLALDYLGNLLFRTVVREQELSECVVAAFRSLYHR